MPTPPDGLENRLFRHWFSDRPVLNGIQRLLLWAAAQMYRALLWGRELWRRRVSPPRRLTGVTVVAIGNLIVGGAGKTPCAIALASAMRDAGIRCGLITRGYRSEAEHGPCRVVDPSELSSLTASQIGDEAWLLAWRTQLPIAVGKNRFEGAQRLKERYPDLQAVLLDDGLQQRSLHCDQRLLVLDERGFGNGACLPLGPLREPIGNLQRFDGWIDHGFRDSPGFQSVAHALPRTYARLSQTNHAWVPIAQWATPSSWLNLHEGVMRFKNLRLLAVAGIAVPARFFETLTGLGLAVDTLGLNDHDPNTVAYVQRRWATKAYDAVLMTEKDAVKFFHQDSVLDIPAWALRRDAILDEDFLTRFVHGLKTA